MHWLLFIHKILISSTSFEPQVLIFRRIQLYTCSIWYCHPLWEFLVACRYTDVHQQATRNSHRGWQYHMLHIYNCILLKMSTWGSKHVEENSILWINNNQVHSSSLTQAFYRQATRNSHRGWQYHMLHVYNCILLKMNTWGSKHVEESSGSCDRASLT